MIKQLTFLGLLWILISNSLATTQEEERAWWISMEGWQSHRGDPNYTALNAILNTSAGEYTHLRGGHRTDEPREFEIGGALGYHFWSRFNLSSRLTYLRIETAGYFVDMSREYTMKWTTQATIPSFRLEFYLPIAEAKSIRTKLFIGFDYYFLTTQIQSKPYIEQIFAEMNKRGMELDVNTSGLRKAFCGEIYPPEDIIQAAKKQSIPLVYGSDAHSAKDVGSDFSLFEKMV